MMNFGRQESLFAAVGKGAYMDTLLRETCKDLKYSWTICESLIDFSRDSKWGLRCLPIR
jgi:hypothetical protein